MSRNWELSIRVLWFSLLCLLWCRPFLAAVPVVRRNSTKASATKPKTPDVKAIGAAGQIAIAQHQLDLHNFANASQLALAAASKTPLLADYAFYIRAQAESELRNYPHVSEAATRVFNHSPVSPLVGPVAALAVRADLDGDRPKDALQLVKKYFDLIPAPEANLLLARCFQANGDLPQAAEYFNRVYYDFPNGHEASDAASALTDLKTRLGDAFPPPMPKDMIGRAQKLFDARNPAAAKIELAAAIPQMAGAERDVARVRLGVADFLSNHAREAFEYLIALKVEDAEADAERLDYLIRCARKEDKRADIKIYLDQLSSQHAASPWRLDALVFAGDQGRIDHDRNTYLPLYQACATTFPKDSKASWCHWQVAFASYINDGPDSYDLIRSQIQQYPGGEEITDAIYFFGRLHERRKDMASARAAYDELQQRFPNTYFALIARDRLKVPAVTAASPSPTVRQFFQEISWPERPQFPSFVPGELAAARIQRAQLLQTTGLSSMAEGELKFGATNDGTQQNVYAYELAKSASARQAPDQAVRFIKHYAPGYLYMPFDQAPASFWKLAFPLPYRSSIDVHSRAQKLDPYFVAALIRQESEFNQTVISYANAYGLMQVLPSTGKQLARQVGLRRFSATQLLSADRNIQLGTRYVSQLMDTFGSKEEYVLASYNAGPSRAKLWQTWGPYEEQAEFVENVPFHQTRNYIQVVLRNADVYRRLYAGSVPEIPTYKPKPAPATKVKPKRKRTRR